MSIDTTVPWFIRAPVGVDGYFTAGSPNQGEAVLNDKAHANYVGSLVETSGFDGPEVRTSIENVAGGHGAHGSRFFHGPRPFTLDVELTPGATFAASHARLEKLQRAFLAMAAEGEILWTPSGGVQRLVRFKRAQPPRGPDNATRRIVLAGISENPRILSNPETPTVITTNTPVTNVGNGTFPPRFQFTPGANPTITNVTTGAKFQLFLTGGAALTVDFATHRVYETTSGISRYAEVNFNTLIPPTTGVMPSWWELIPGVNNISITGASGATMYWRSAWI